MLVGHSLFVWCNYKMGLFAISPPDEQNNIPEWLLLEKTGSLKHRMRNIGGIYKKVKQSLTVDGAQVGL